MKSCFFIGHRDAGEEVAALLAETIEHHISAYGVRIFYVGHYGAFDSLAARAVIASKKRHSCIRLYMLLPYHPADRPVPVSDGFDGTYYPEGQETVPRRVAIIRANEYMVRNSDYLIAYVQHPSAGAREILELALKRQQQGFIQVTNLAGWNPTVSK